MSSTELHFESLPTLGSFYAKALFGRKPGLPAGASIPAITASVAPLVPDAAHVAAFRQVCGTPQSTSLPLLFPHVLAAPLHFAILMAKPFPYKALGLVHVSNQVTSFRPIASTEALSLRTWVEGPRKVARGVLFDLMTRVESRGECVWESVSTIIRIERAAPPRQGPPAAPTSGIEPGPSRTAMWRLPKDMGRRYAKVSGDFNPIHLTAWSAKLFGFKRAIVHGMWAFSRTLAEVEVDLHPGPLTIDVAFKRPIFLPSRVLFSAYDAGATTTLSLTTPDGAKPHILGSVTRI